MEGIYRLLLSDESYPVNIGNPNEMTILEFAQAVVDVAGSKSEIRFVQPEDARIKDDPKQRRPDISKAQRILGWEPQVQLHEGLALTIDYFKDRV